MGDLMNVILSADDEYLTGLTNKGTLKRAYKDMESGEISAEYGDDEITVSTGGEKCTIKNPLAESKCSCPSRSICRHIITSILWLKQNSDKEETSKEPEKVGLDETLKNELSCYPLKVLEKAMKKKYYTDFMRKAEIGTLPEIEETTIVSVKFPDDITVRLISPLEYSTCSCHSKELCQHKAAAILSWQIKNKIVEPKVPEAKEKTEIDVAKAHDTAEYALKFLSGILSDGLVRLSDNTAEHAETVAVMCHNARLADSERQIREIGSRLEKYISHSPEFDSKKLYMLIIESIILLGKIIKSEDAKTMSKYSGEFKAEYILSESMDLVPLTSRHFSSLDYEGNIYYFINKDEKSENKFLTYSDIRPKFYEGNRSNSKYTSAPWGLSGNMQDIMKNEIRLKSPRISNGKLSSSADTDAVILGKRDINSSCVYKKVYTDFAKMVYETFNKKSHNENDGLVFIASEKCVSSEFDEITQSQRVVIEDRQGRRISLKARYRNESSDIVERLDKTGKIMMNNPGINYVIFGSAYIEKGNCYIYPIGIYDDIYVSKMTTKSHYISELSGVYLYFHDLFDEVQNMLCDIIQCGINSFDLYTQIKDNANESQKMGLLEFSNMLAKLEECFRAKNHTYSNDNSEIINLLESIYLYLETGISMTEVHIAVSNLQKESE